MKGKMYCRLCLSVVGCKNMSDQCLHGKSYTELLYDTFNIELKPSYKTYSICDACINKLGTATTFKALVLKTQETISQAWDILKDNVDFEIKLNDKMNGFDGKVANTIKSNFVCVESTPYEAGSTIISVKQESEQNDQSYTVFDDCGSCISDTLQKVPSTQPRKNILVTSRKKSIKKHATERNKNTSIKNLKTVNSVKPKDQNSDRLPISQTEIDARENTLKLIQNSNLCLFRSLKTKFGCFMCKASFVEPKDLRKHSITHTNTTFLAYRVSKWRGLSYKSVDISKLECNRCSQKIASLNELLNHLKENHELIFYGTDHLLIPYKLVEENQCALCEIKFKTFLRLSMHMNTHYANNVCEICGLPFINRLSLRMHVQCQHKEKKCSHCPAKFLTLSSQAKHLRQVHKMGNIKRYCNLCDKTFLYAYLLDKHKIEEHGAKKLVVTCSECGRSFYNEANLRVHKRSVHIKERNHPCEICGTRFFTKFDQKRHEKTHNDVRSFLCLHCDAKFKSKDSWRRHLKRQHAQSK